MLALLLAWGLWGPPETAADPDAVVTLNWRAPPSCPDRAAATRQIERILGREMSVAAERALDFDVDILGDAGTEFAATLEIGDAKVRSRRELADRDCAILADALTFIIASTIDPDVVHPDLLDSEGDGEPEAGSASSSSDPASESKALQEPKETSPEVTPSGKDQAGPDPVSDREPDAPRERGAWRSELGGVGALGSLPAPNVGLHLGLSAQWGRLRLLLAGSHHFPRSAGDADVGADVSMSLASLQACYAPSAGAWVFATCAGAAAGAQHALPRGTDRTGRRSLPWAAAVLTGGVHWRPEGRLSAFVRVEGRLVATRPRFALDDGTLVHLGSSFDGALVLGPEFRFW